MNRLFSVSFFTEWQREYELALSILGCHGDKRRPPASDTLCSHIHRSIRQYSAPRLQRVVMYRCANWSVSHLSPLTCTVSNIIFWLESKVSHLWPDVLDVASLRRNQWHTETIFAPIEYTPIKFKKNIYMVGFTSEITDEIRFGRRDHELHPCPRMKQAW